MRRSSPIKAASTTESGIPARQNSTRAATQCNIAKVRKAGSSLRHERGELPLFAAELAVVCENRRSGSVALILVDETAEDIYVGYLAHPGNETARMSQVANTAVSARPTPRASGARSPTECP